MEVRASGERNESFALGKRFAVAKLTATRNPLSEKALEVRASGERNESFALGKRFAVAKLTASLSPRA